MKIVLNLLLFCFFSSSVFGQCLPGFRDIQGTCIPEGTVSNFLAPRETIFRFIFEDLQDSSGNDNTLIPSSSISIVPVPLNPGNNGAQSSSSILISEVYLTPYTCFNIKFYRNSVLSDLNLISLAHSSTPTSRVIGINVTKSGKIQIRNAFSSRNTRIVVKPNSLNTIGVCFRYDGKVIIAHNGERYATFTFPPLQFRKHHITLGTTNNIVIDEVLAYKELYSVDYDHSLVFSKVPDYPYQPLGFLTTGSTAAFTFVGEPFGQKSLYVTNFGGPFGGTIEAIYDIGSQLNMVNSLTTTTIASGVIWPNKAEDIPEEVFGQNYIAVVGGFLVPFANNGSIYVVNLNNGDKHEISTIEAFYYYHMIIWYDVDGDGLLDILSAKTQFRVSLNSKFVWFKNPGDMTFPWQENLLIENGPDVFFRLHDFENDGIPEIVAAIAFRGKLSIYKNNGIWSNPGDWVEKVIESSIGIVFDVKVTDMNKDGKVDLLVTNHVGFVNESAVYVYEVPDDVMNGNYIRRTIAIGSFKTTQPGFGQASPGSPIAFHPKVSETNEKPFVFLSGDGTQRAYLLRPLSRSPSNWDYDLIEVLYGNNTLGGVSVGDVDGDGFAEMFAPVYEVGRVYAYTFAP